MSISSHVPSAHEHTSQLMSAQNVNIICAYEQMVLRQCICFPKQIYLLQELELFKGFWMLSANLKKKKKNVFAPLGQENPVSALSSCISVFEVCMRVHIVLGEKGEAERQAAVLIGFPPKQFLFLKIAAALPTWTRGKSISVQDMH